MKQLKLAFFVLLVASAAHAVAQPIVHVVAEVDKRFKWDNSNGDTWDPFWADDDQLYAFNCDGRGFGKKPRNLAFNRFSGSELTKLVGEQINSMDDYGPANGALADGATWKVCGQECIDGVFYAFIARNAYGYESHDPLMRQTSINASLIKSPDRGLTWTAPEKTNYIKPMWPGNRFGAPGFIHYGKNGGNVAQDAADQFVYVVSNNGFWNGGDDFILARIRRTELTKLQPADWNYWTGGDGIVTDNWSPDLGKAKSILSRPAECGWTSPTYLPALNRYLLISWYVTPTLKKWFEPGEVKYDFYQAEHPWGPWAFVDSLSDKFLPKGHMYGPNVCAKFQKPDADGNLHVLLFNSGCPFEDQPSGLYKAWAIPLTLKIRP